MLLAESTRLLSLLLAKVSLGSPAYDARSPLLSRDLSLLNAVLGGVPSEMDAPMFSYQVFPFTSDPS